MSVFPPRLVVAGLCGGTGKTTVSLGLVRAFARQGLCVRPFKKGPDYIDTAWLGRAAGTEAGTLDPFFCPGPLLRRHFCRQAAGADLALIEGNRGYFDGRDLAGSASTAEVARIVDAPVLLVVDITKMTRTTAALVAGCRQFPGGERIAGVVLNKAGNDRHAALAARAVEELAGVPVFGVLPRLDLPPLPEHRAGLVAVDGHGAAEEALDAIAACVSRHICLEAVLAAARAAAPWICEGVGEAAGPCVCEAAGPCVCEGPGPCTGSCVREGVAPDVLPATVPCAASCIRGSAAAGDTRAPSPGRLVRPPRIGIVRDAVLWQYYEENLDALCEAGAELVFLSLAGCATWPELDGLYLGGGDLAPHAPGLAADTAGKDALRAMAEAGMPIYAEHAGCFCLGQSLSLGEREYAMAGVFPLRADFIVKPVRLGYTEALVTRSSPFFSATTRIKGHEYHYALLTVDAAASSLEKTCGKGAVAVPDGLVYKNAFGASMQIFAPAVPGWAPAFVAAAAAWREGRTR